MLYKEDKFLKYDSINHRYYITPEYILNYYGTNLSEMSAFREDINPSTAVERYLKRLSMVLYNYIYEYANDKEIMEYLLASKYEWRDAIREALGELAYSFSQTGNDFSLVNGLTLDSGKELEYRDLMIQLFPPSVKHILEANDILWRGKRIGYKIKDIRALKESGEY